MKATLARRLTGRRRRSTSATLGGDHEEQVVRRTCGEEREDAENAAPRRTEPMIARARGRAATLNEQEALSQNGYGRM